MSESKLSSVLPNNTIKDAWPRKPVSTIYVENSNNLSTLEDIQWCNDIEMSFPQQLLGAVNTFRFPRTYQFLGPIVFSFQVAWSAQVDNAIKEDFFAYNVIKRIRWTVGGTETLTVEGQSLLPLILDQCETEEKKAELLDAAGTAITGTAINNLTSHYAAVIPCPWSSIGARGFNCIKPLPLHMLSEPVELQVELRSRAEVLLEPTAAAVISNLKLRFYYGKIGNPEQLKNVVYKWPFTSIFSHNFVVPNQAVSSIDLNAFRRAELRQLRFHVVLDANLTTANSLFNTGEKLRNIQLKFNGQIIWSQENDTDQIWDLIMNRQPSKLPYRKLYKLGVAAVDGVHHKGQITGLRSALNANDDIVYRGYVSNVQKYKEKYYYNIPLGEILDKYVKQGHNIGVDVSKQVLTLSFNGLGAAATLFISYVYSAMYQFDGEMATLVY